jgi:hypothetical protein
MGDLFQLRELHDTYVWEVNAAVGENRLDLVYQLADDYMDRALRLMTAGESPACGSPDCAVCARSHQPRPSSQGHRFGFRRRRSA